MPGCWCHLILVLGLVAGCGSAFGADQFINEVLFNPQGTDSPFEYIELRGPPNYVLGPGTYFVAVEGGAGANPGTIQNVFDLSGLTIGGNGFLVLLQKDSPYLVDAHSTVFLNTNSGAGWGSGSTSSLGHRGFNGITDLKNPSVTFFLVQAPSAPVVGTDIDANNDGLRDGAALSDWIILDSIGVLGPDGAGDIAYGRVNFRQNSAPGNTALASGVIIPIGFIPRYIGRSGNTTGFGPADWVATGVLSGVAPNWVLGASTNTYPQSFANRALDHIGAANFGAPPLPGVVLIQATGGTVLTEDGAAGAFSLGLNSQPLGPVSIRLDCPSDLLLSLDQGTNYASTGSIVLSNATPRTILTRAPGDDLLTVSPRLRWITNTIASTSDPANYPLASLVPNSRVYIRERDVLLLNELEVNPPGTNDSPCEFIELKGRPGVLLSNVVLLALEGDTGNDPGHITWKVDLTGVRLGSNGLLLIAATNHPYSPAPDTAILLDSSLSQPGGALGNGTISFLVLSTTNALAVGEDLDRGDNGVLERLPADASILDSVGWKDSDANDLVYAIAELRLPGAAPDAASRLALDDAPNSASAWAFGELEPSSAASLLYDAAASSSNNTAGTTLTPGAPNNLAPFAVDLVPISGVIGDPYNPVVEFSVVDDQNPASMIQVTATSNNQDVVPNTNLVISVGPGDARSLAISPVGVGYAEITLWLKVGTETGWSKILYAASDPGRAGGIWHLGASDGSTAIPLDDQYMFVGDDENQVIRLYDRRRSGLPLASFNMTSFLALPDAQSGLPREVDIEASTRVGNRLFWIGSLGHAANGESRTNRTRVFGTDISGTGASSQLVYAGRYDFLKVDLIAWDACNLHGKGTNYYGLDASDAEGVPPKAPDGSGFAIEGLSMLPGSTNAAYIGFRAPIVPATNRTFALLVPVLNFAELAVSGRPPGSAIFGPPLELDLYGRGIRSIECQTNGALIIGGPPGGQTGPYPQDFRLYSWTGSVLDQPQQRGADLAGLSPEGIVEIPASPWSSTTPVQLLSDQGGVVFYNDGIPAKLLPVRNFKKARSDWVELGRPETPMPVIVSATMNNGICDIAWRSLKGVAYRIQTSTNLAGGSWQDASQPVAASGPYLNQSVQAKGAEAFFRVSVAQ